MRTAAKPLRLTEQSTRHLMLLGGVMLTLLALATPSHAVELSVGTSSGFVGDTVTVPVSVDDLTGLDVVSYEFTITWSQTYAQAVGAEVLGTLSAAWGPVAFSSGPGWLRVAAAGATPLSGAGTLVEVDFLLGPNSGSPRITPSEALFNEGDPPTTAQDYGTLTISALPTINVSPDTGEIAVGENLSFSSSGGTAPYTYSTSDPAVGNFVGNLLFGLSPGAVTVNSTDDMALVGSSTGVIEVRALRLTVQDAVGSPGDFVWVGLDITNPTAYSITSFSLAVTYNASRLTALAAGNSFSLIGEAGWALPLYNVSEGRIDIAASGISPLPGSGTLLNILFRVEEGAPTSNNTLTAVDGIFKEIYPPRHVSGTFAISAPPTLTIFPDQPELVVGDVQGFTVSGADTPPLSWGVTNPAVGSIDASGQFEALAAGSTRVFMVDAVGATDTTSSFQVCDFYLDAPDGPLYSSPTTYHLRPDRSVTGMGIQGYEFVFDWDDTYIEMLGIEMTATSSEPWGFPVSNLKSDQAILVNAGSFALETDAPLLRLSFRALPPLYGTSRSITISKLLFNEGSPCARVRTGSMQGVEIGTSTPDTPLRQAALGQNHPNPFNPSTRIEYSMPAAGQARLSVYDVSGALVAKLVDDWHPQPGDYSVLWNGRTTDGRTVPSGVYFYRLETEGVDLKRKMMLLK